jgi:hypothetical protein
MIPLTPESRGFMATLGHFDPVRSFVRLRIWSLSQPNPVSSNEMELETTNCEDASSIQGATRSGATTRMRATWRSSESDRHIVTSANGVTVCVCVCVCVCVFGVLCDVCDVCKYRVAQEKKVSSLSAVE